MIKATIIRSKTKSLTQLIVSGHSFKKTATEIEPLCATVSAVVVGAVNQLNTNEKYRLGVKITVKNGYTKIIVLEPKNSEILVILETVITQLITIKLFFKKNFVIEEKV